MYKSYFGLKENPFNLTPDPRYLFLSRKHQEALSHLRYGIKERKGFVLITGNIGTGKTTLIRALLSDLDRNVKTALIFNAYISDQEILHAILQEFGIQADSNLTNKQCIDLLNRFFLKCYQKNQNAVLFLDEAQNLSPKVLEQIRMLSNLETEKEKLLQIVMVGQSELKDMLNEEGLRQLNERISVRYDLDTLEKNDVRSYILHRLTVAGAKGMIHFSKWAFRSIYKVSNGNPRLINSICDRALLIAYSRDRFSIDKEIILQASENVKGQKFVYNSKQKFFRRFAYAGVLGLALFLVVFLGWYSNSKWFKNFIQTVNKKIEIIMNNKTQQETQISNIQKTQENIIEKNQESEIKKTQENIVKKTQENIVEKIQENKKIQLSNLSESITASVNNTQTMIKDNKIITSINNTQILVKDSKLKKNQTLASEMPGAISATSVISMMTRVTGDIVLDHSNSLSATSKSSEMAIEHSTLSKGTAVTQSLTNTHQNKKQFTSDISSSESITTTEKGVTITDSKIFLSKTEEKQVAEKNIQPMEFSTFQPFIKTENKKSKLFLTMETTIPEDLVQKKQPDKMDTLSFFLGEPWEQGMTAPEIMWVQRTLNDAGYPVKITGTYSKETVEAVKLLQADFGLDVDGIIGPQSKWALYQLSTTRLKDYYE